MAKKGTMMTYAELLVLAQKNIDLIQQATNKLAVASERIANMDKRDNEIRSLMNDVHDKKLKTWKESK